MGVNTFINITPCMNRIHRSMHTSSLGQPVLASIQNSEWPHFRASFVQ